MYKHTKRTRKSLKKKKKNERKRKQNKILSLYEPVCECMTDCKQQTNITEDIS